MVGVVRPSDLAAGAPDEADAGRRAERLFDAAAQSGLDLTHLDENALRVATLSCQRAPYLATVLTRDPLRLARVSRADRSGNFHCQECSRPLERHEQRRLENRVAWAGSRFADCLW